MSSPHVCGVAALYMAEGVKNVEFALISNGTPNVLKLQENTNTPNVMLYSQLPTQKINDFLF